MSTKSHGNGRARSLWGIPRFEISPSFLTGASRQVVLLEWMTGRAITRQHFSVYSSVQGWCGRSGEFTGSRRNRPPQFSGTESRARHFTSGHTPSLALVPD